MVKRLLFLGKPTLIKGYVDIVVEAFDQSTLFCGDMIDLSEESVPVSPFKVSIYAAEVESSVNN